MGGKRRKKNKHKHAKHSGPTMVNTPPNGTALPASDSVGEASQSTSASGKSHQAPASQQPQQPKANGMSRDTKIGVALAFASNAISLLTWAYALMNLHVNAYVALIGASLAIILVPLACWFFFEMRWKGRVISLLTACVLCAPIWIYLPLPDVVMTFKVSPLLTASKKRRITRVVDNFRNYLTDMGYSVGKEVPPLGVSPGLVSSGGVTHGGAYGSQMVIPSESLGDPDDAVRDVYAFYLFRELIPNYDANEQDVKMHSEAVRIIADYYRCSYENRFSYYQPFPPELEKWESSLWELRRKYGKEMMDRALVLALHQWPPYGFAKNNPDTGFNDYFALRIEIGLSQFDNNMNVVNDLREFWKKKGFLTQ